MLGPGCAQKVDVKRRQQDEDYVALPGGQEAHWEVVERILFIYAKLNPGQSYVQGMNEIVGPIYYTFASDRDVRWRGRYHGSSRCVCSVHRWVCPSVCVHDLSGVLVCIYASFVSPGFA